MTAPLQKCLTNIAAKKILEAAKARKDETILRQIEGEDIIAMDTVYHKTCYATDIQMYQLRMQKEIEELRLVAYVREF